MRAFEQHDDGCGRLPAIRAVPLLIVACSLFWGPASPAGAQTLSLLDVPYLSQSEALCGGAAAAMVLRFWGAEDLTSESFAALVDDSAAGIRTDVLAADVVRRGWNAVAVERDAGVIARELDSGRPVIALIEDRPGTYHYVVVVAWHPRGIVLHDPARVPYRVMSVDEFSRRWSAARQWALLVTPAVLPSPRPAESPSALRSGAPAASTACDATIARGVAEAQAGELGAAERTLSGALSCPGVEPFRELAGVRALQRRWQEVIDLATPVVRDRPDDAYAWQLLATARFVTDDSAGALAAWNAAGQPALDLFDVRGLVRTRQRVVERLTALAPGDLLTPDRLKQAERQIAEWPAATRAAVTYLPRPGGRVDLRVSLAERGLLPSGPIALGTIGGRALFTREVRVELGPLTGDGDRVELAWRFWPDRPRYAAGLMVPAPWGGIWGVQASSERQPFTEPVPVTLGRDSAGIVLSRWHTGYVRWQANAGLDQWTGRARYLALGGAVELVTHGDGLRLRARGQSWRGDTGFGAAEISARASRAVRNGRYVVELRGAMSRVSPSAPFDIWPAGDTGLVRTTLLRAHPLVRRGTFLADRLGSAMVASSLDVQRVYRYRGAQIGPAVFADVGRTARRIVGRTIVDTDVGVGLRARMPGMRGVVRIDVARGMRDGARALSFVYEP